MKTSSSVRVFRPSDLSLSLVVVVFTMTFVEHICQQREELWRQNSLIILFDFIQHLQQLLAQKTNRKILHLFSFLELYCAQLFDSFAHAVANTREIVLQ